jgi:hypothetical protein
MVILAPVNRTGYPKTSLLLNVISGAAAESKTNLYLHMCHIKNYQLIH